MHCHRLLHKWLANTFPWTRAMRREGLSAVVWAAVLGTPLKVTGLGRSMVSQAKVCALFVEAAQWLRKYQ